MQREDALKPLRVLSIDNAMLSLHSHMVISNERGDEVYSCSSHVGLVGPAWTIKRHGVEVAGMHRALGLTSRWHVDGELGTFDVRRHLLSLTHTLDVDGGPFSGASLHGNVVDRSFYLTWRGQRLAQATAGVLSVKDHHRIDLFSSEADIELIVVIGLVGVHAEHLRERSA